MTVTASTRLLGLLGWPVAHSLSPQLHAAAIAAAGLDLVYLAFAVPPDGLPAAVAGLGALGAVGVNVTVPHKQAVLAFADEVTPEATQVGAANTLLWRDGRLTADNTDAAGLGEVLRSLAVGAGDPVVLFGAGGAARAAAVALGRAGAQVEVVARRPEAARAVDAVLRDAGATVGRVARPRLVVNATPLGLHGEPLPARLTDLGPGQIALDLVYGPEPTPFLREAAASGARTESGLSLLVAQAALSFARWTGLPPPVEVMRRAAAAANGRKVMWTGSPRTGGEANLQ